MLDTNVAVSAFLWGGKPAALFEMAATGRIALFTSHALIDELRTTLTKPKLQRAIIARGLMPAEHILRYQLTTKRVRPKPSDAFSRDPDDDHVIACAIAAKADMIVSGDDDLLVLKQVDGIRIRRVAEALGELVG